MRMRRMLCGRQTEGKSTDCSTPHTTLSGAVILRQGFLSSSKPSSILARAAKPRANASASAWVSFRPALLLGKAGRHLGQEAETNLLQRLSVKKQLPFSIWCDHTLPCSKQDRNSFGFIWAVVGRENSQRERHQQDAQREQGDPKRNPA